MSTLVESRSFMTADVWNIIGIRAEKALQFLCLHIASHRPNDFLKVENATNCFYWHLVVLCWHNTYYRWMDLVWPWSKQKRRGSCRDKSTFQMFIFSTFISGESTVIWKQSNRIISAGDVVIRKDPRISLHGGFNLRIDNLRENDAGNILGFQGQRDKLPLTRIYFMF